MSNFMPPSGEMHEIGRIRKEDNMRWEKERGEREGRKRGEEEKGEEEIEKEIDDKGTKKKRSRNGKRTRLKKL